MNGRRYGHTDSTGLRLLRFPTEPLPCSHNCYHYEIPKQGKATDDHLLPLVRLVCICLLIEHWKDVDEGLQSRWTDS